MSEIEKLRQTIKELQLENKKLKLSLTNSNTAKNGYKEEQLVCDDLNTNDKLKSSIPCIFNECNTVKGRGKIDIVSNDNKFKAQIKKFKFKRFQQIDRHWIDSVIKHIPDLKNIEYMLKQLCEIQLSGNNIDKSKKRIPLSTKYYTKAELNTFIKTLNDNKDKILKYIFHGISDEYPEYLIGVEYTENNKRNRILIYEISKIIEYLNSKSFEISKGCTTIKLGNCLTIQRKGGDGGKKTSNHIQFKLIISNLDTTHIEYQLN